LGNAERYQRRKGHGKRFGSGRLSAEIATGREPRAGKDYYGYRPAAISTSADGMKPTHDAEILADLHAKLLLDVMALPEQLKALSGEMTGRVAVGLLPLSEQDVVVKAFGKMLRRHRHVRLQAVTGSYAALIDGLRQGELDFVVGPLRNPPPYDTLEELHLYDESFAFVVRPDHPLAKRRPTLAELAQENWVVAPHGTPTRRYFEALLIAEGLTPPAQTCEIVTFFLAEQMIINSDAIALLTYSDRKLSVVSNKLKVLPLDLPDNKRAMGLTFRKHQAFTPAQKIFVEALVDEAPTLSGELRSKGRKAAARSEHAER
jgi:LysR family transcriptional regulator, regulator for genes of the gallate degradation pathway